MESSPERRISAVVAIVGDDERLAGAIERALRSRGASAVSISVEKLLDDPPPHDLALVIGSPALDGGEALLGRMRESKKRVAVVLRDAALNERLAAHRCGASVVLRKASADAMADQIGRLLADSDKPELGWTSLASIVDLLRQALGARLSVDPSARTELMLGDPSGVAEAIERCADELGMLAFQSRAGAGSTVAVDDLGWEDDPKTATQSAEEMERWRKLAAKGDVHTLTPFFKPRKEPSPEATTSAPDMNLADALEPDEGVSKSGPRRVPQAKEPEDAVPAVLSPDAQAAAPPSPTEPGTARVVPPSEPGTAARVVPPTEPGTGPRTEPGTGPRTEPTEPGTGPRTEPEPGTGPRTEPGTGLRVTAARTRSRSKAWILKIGVGLLAFVVLGLAGLGVLTAIDRARQLSRIAEPEALDEQPSADPTLYASPSEQAAPTESAELAGDIVEQAHTYERDGRWDQARAAWEAVLATEPHDPHALAGLARERMHAMDAEGAIRFAERASQLRRRRAGYRVLLGDAHRLAGHEAEARSNYEAALALEPGNADAQARLAGAPATPPAE